MDNILAVIPARAGSKRVPGKNVRLLAGRSLLQRAIDSARASGVFRRILVSTDDASVAQLAVSAGAEAPWLRSPVLATDEANVVEAVIELLERLETQGYAPDAVMLLQPTSPFRAPSTIRRAWELFKENPESSVVSLSRAESHPYWCRKVDSGGFMVPFVSDAPSFVRSQDLPPAYVLNGLIYLTPARHLRDSRSFYTAQTRALVVDSHTESLDIDTMLDWQVAEAIATNETGARA